MRPVVGSPWPSVSLLINKLDAVKCYAKSEERPSR